ncbi:DUF4294 domain-containing protein [Nonlabens marinus]|uniref:DUF4294 domain-containing protein n=1 Tax=Nonlabens marinus S1-08 TaxID=1454201 RepID=W8VRJ7_9FLAO|nr:DUF4294 domain-containing protein [Nonlabens marinus]BAO56309.1 hypothetical protein NMS_2300 [Nonlabens marinus S1-08]
MNKRVLFVIVSVFVFAFAEAQTTPTTLPTPGDTVKTASPDYYYIDGDSVSAIELDEVLLIQDLKFTSRYERIRYLILQRKVKRVWPYAKLAAERLTELDERLASIPDARGQRKYAKMVEDYIEDEFTAELKKLTRTEGQILIKLIHRQTGDTAYELIRRLRSGWSAFWFNNTASIFDISLKEEYQPTTNVEDFYVEDILQQQFKREGLEPQESAIEFDYFTGRNNWKAFQSKLPEDYDKVKLAERAQKIEEYKKKKQKKEAKKAKRERRRKN